MQNGFLLVKPTRGGSDKPDHMPANTDRDSYFVLELEWSLPLFLLLFPCTVLELINQEISCSETAQ